MSLVTTRAHRLLLAVGAAVIAVPGIRLLVDTAGYVDGKDNLTLTPDLYNDLRAMGSLFVASGLVLIGGAAARRVRAAATLVGIVAFLPQGITRLVSYAIDEGQHDSYLRAGVVETILGLVLTLFLVHHFRAGVSHNRPTNPASGSS